MGGKQVLDRSRTTWLDKPRISSLHDSEEQPPRRAAPARSSATRPCGTRSPRRASRRPAASSRTRSATTGRRAPNTANPSQTRSSSTASRTTRFGRAHAGSHCRSSSSPHPRARRRGVGAPGVAAPIASCASPFRRPSFIPRNHRGVLLVFVRGVLECLWRRSSFGAVLCTADGAVAPPAST